MSPSDRIERVGRHGGAVPDRGARATSWRRPLHRVAIPFAMLIAGRITKPNRNEVRTAQLALCLT